VRDRYLPLGRLDQLRHVFDNARLAGADRVYIDSPYIDLDYRSDLAHFYARAFRPPPATTERLLFADDRRLLGSCVVRPLPQPVGRTMMTPPPAAAPYICCKTTATINAFGRRWPVEGFPFTSQDGEYGVCAHAAIWAIARYHHLRFQTDRQTVSSIIEAAGLRERTDRTARSEGLYALDILRAFRGIGLPALSYSIDEIPPSETVPKVVCRYLNSGIPVGVLSEDHMVVLNGYGEHPDGSVFYFQSDDNSHAYKRLERQPSSSEDGAWKMLVIPLPGRIHVSGEVAETRAEEAFEDRVRADSGPGHLLAAWDNHDLQVRTYAVPAARYVERLGERGIPAAIVNHHIYAPKSGWLWVSEFQDRMRSADERVLGEIAIDATSQQLNPTPLFANIDGWAYLWEENQEEPRVIQLAQASAHFSELPDRSVPVPHVEEPQWETDFTPDQVA
jgi:hypothetical protein